MTDAVLDPGPAFQSRKVRAAGVVERRALVHHIMGEGDPDMEAYLAELTQIEEGVGA